ncbi:MAG: hypothetical protein J0M08_13040 [Bacteroidetes bacterium]|nr:hypothetical protein [Bacteroidota bacterium]
MKDINAEMKMLVSFVNSTTRSYSNEKILAGNVVQYWIKSNKYNGLDVHSGGYTLCLQLYKANLDNDNYAAFSIFQGSLDKEGYADVFQKAKPIRISKFTYQPNNLEGKWQDQENIENVFSSEKLADIFITDFLSTYN